MVVLTVFAAVVVSTPIIHIVRLVVVTRIGMWSVLECTMVVVAMGEAIGISMSLVASPLALVTSPTTAPVPATAKLTANYLAKAPRV